MLIYSNTKSMRHKINDGLESSSRIKKTTYVGVDGVDCGYSGEQGRIYDSVSVVVQHK